MVEFAGGRAWRTFRYRKQFYEPSRYGQLPKPEEMPFQQNIVGPRIQALRREKGLTQAMLAARCGMLGWDVGENVVTKIETQIRCVVDAELLCLAKALDVAPEQLLPSRDKTKPAIRAYFSGHDRT